MLRNTLAGLDKKQLRRWLSLFFLALAIPTAILIQQSYSRLKWETFHQHQQMADELANRINSQFLRLINKEEQRPFTDYAFLNVAGDPTANFLQRSPLSQFPIKSEIPGVIGYFQVDAAGELLTPLVPDLNASSNYGISEKELASRITLQDQIQTILSKNHLVQNDDSQSFKLNKEEGRGSISRSDSISSSVESYNESNADQDEVMAIEEKDKRESQGQVAFDRLKKISPAREQQSKFGRLEDIELSQRYNNEPTKENVLKDKGLVVGKLEKRARTEQNILPEAITAPKYKQDRDFEKAQSPAEPVFQSDSPSLRIRTFESEIDPFEFSLLDSGHFVLFRKVWLNEQRYIQGVLIDQDSFLTNIISSAFRETSLASMSNLLVVFQGDVLSAFSGQTSRDYLSSNRELNGELLYQTRLSDPLSDMQLLFSITKLPAGPGGKVVIWLALILASVLCAGFYLMYRLGLGQINLANQQQDFVSAVSHELKTPLTSIRMYGEMLREGWASEEKKKTYYDFIFDESERLSRLINNVLHLARMTRNEQQSDLKTLTVAELMDGVQSKVSTQIERSGFELDLQCNEDAAQSMIKVDADWFTQIMINLVDNAIKFSDKAEKKIIQLGCQRLSDNTIQFNVRDFGPGVAPEQMKKIFKLFYRTESELTRETAGTGIGLALVHQMIMNMDGQIDVVNSDPGAEFKVKFPIQQH